MRLEWSEIEGRLPTLQPAAGGFSPARRGVITLADGRRAFVKLGTNDNTRAWARKEVAVYRGLAVAGCGFLPKLLAASDDGTGFALEALEAADGWDWSDQWSPARLEATLAAVDALAEIRPDALPTELIAPALTARNDGWSALAREPDRATMLVARAAELGAAPQARDAVRDLHDQAARSAGFDMRFDRLIHLDVRSDNCAWRGGGRSAVRLVDWNWLQVGDRRIDQAALLASVHATGFNVTALEGDRLDSGALHWLAGFWLEAAAQPIWPGGPAQLRGFQLHLGLTALELSSEAGLPKP